jgi:hypothetical protein
MANPEHVKAIKSGVRTWNAWRKKHSRTSPNLSGARLIEAVLEAANLDSTNLEGAYLSNASLGNASLKRSKLAGAVARGAAMPNVNFVGSDLSGTDLRNAHLAHAYFGHANLSAADLRESTLWGADFFGARLTKANLRCSDLSGVNFTGADLSDADIGMAKIAVTTFGDNDLRSVKGLDCARHEFRSVIGIDTIFRSKGDIPESFLRGCGVPDDFIVFAKSLVSNPIDFYSCFISYSTNDQAFADRLYGDLQSKGVRCWFAPHDIQGGRKIHEQIDEAIRLHDKLLLILSPHSMESEWVKAEIARPASARCATNVKCFSRLALCLSTQSKIGSASMPTPAKIPLAKFANISFQTSATGRTTTPIRKPSHASSPI